MQKRGLFEMSFSMIFSIILIVVFIALAGYVIFKLVIPVKECAETELFFKDLQNYITEAWQADEHQDIFSNKGALPPAIKFVCFGNFSQIPSQEDKDKFEVLKGYNERTKNVFLYPPEKVCTDSPSSTKLAHIRTNSFFCVPIENGKIKVKTEGKLGQPVLLTE